MDQGVSEEDFELIRGSGNVFRDFGYADAEVRQAKCILAAEILKTLDERRWSTRKAQEETGINHADFSRIRRVNIDRFSIERLTAILSAMGRDVAFSVQVSPRKVAARGVLLPSPA